MKKITCIGVEKMTRHFNGKTIELLAPSGNFEIFSSIVQTRCDAIYLGGKTFNMRMIRKGFNFTNNEIKQAIKQAHAVDKKVYVTVNNLLHDLEIEEALDYLSFLASTEVDGIIVQDLGIVEVCKEHQLSLPIHSSVMMNVHNLDYVNALKEAGVTRVVLSREMDLQTAKYIQSQTGIETEYFVHGDMCTVNGSNCYFSSTIWGNSSNRGRCFKPCRWSYRIKKDGYLYPTEYPLAAKDMYMYEHIPELIEANVTSFKIEGRMRETDFIVDLVNTYADAIDRYIADPIGYDRKEQAEHLFNNRKRDFTTAYAFGNPGLEFINRRYEGTGKFYSTGKMFSTPTEEPELHTHFIKKIADSLPNSSNKQSELPRLAVKVNNMEQAKLCITLGVDRIYLAADVFFPDQPFTIKQIKELVQIKQASEVFFAFPQMVNQSQVEQIDQFLHLYGDLFDGLLVTNLGSIYKYGKNFHVVADYNVNIYNQKASQFYKTLGINELTTSIEAKADQLGQFIARSQLPIEMIAHGPLKVMYLDLDLYDNTKVLDPIEQQDNRYVANHILTLQTDKGENPVYRDQFGKNHLLTMKTFCLLPAFHHLQAPQIKRYRIEGQTYALDHLKKIILTYQQAIVQPEIAGDLFEQLTTDPAGYTLGALAYQYQNGKQTVQPKC